MRRSSVSAEEARYGFDTSDAVSTGSMAVSSSGTPVTASNNPQLETADPHSIGIDAIKKLRQNYNINKVLAYLERRARLSSRVCRFLYKCAAQLLSFNF